jgi:hypothetical protein
MQTSEKPPIYCSRCGRHLEYSVANEKGFDVFTREPYSRVIFERYECPSFFHDLWTKYTGKEKWNKQL